MSIVTDTFCTTIMEDALCQDLSLQVTDDAANNQVLVSYVCEGTGSEYLVTVRDSDGSLVYTETITTGVGEVALTETGEYTVSCLVGGSSGIMCGGEPWTITTRETTVSALSSVLDTDTTLFATYSGGLPVDDISFTDLLATLDWNDYINHTLYTLENQLYQDTIAYLFDELLALSVPGVMPPPVFPVTTPLWLVDTTDKIRTHIQTLLATTCSEQCVQTIEIDTIP